MANPVYIDIYDLLVNSLLVSLFLNAFEVICLHTVKGFQVELFHFSNSIYQVFLIQYK